MNITVYLGSNEGKDPKLKTAARELGTWIGENHHTLIYDGSKRGLMGELAESTLLAGGSVIGVEPQFFLEMGFDYDEITQLIPTKDIHCFPGRNRDAGGDFRDHVKSSSGPPAGSLHHLQPERVL